ncbi:hypothetical protein [Bacteroides caecimuris]|jgi:metal-responsive CopG/Arc/MetJ family transcriptional regulator|uniref:hypothetical protein n=1 Tax=Bacteroides caecimuris TaxID=1796613 RepID=UPI0025703757|nr:hypothetical protein [Bacteroides caecimuris]
MQDKYQAQKEYAKRNIKKIGCSFQKDFVDEFKIACKGLGISQSEVIKKAMIETIDKYKNQM